MENLDKLFRILDENFLMYKKLNNGTHIKIWDESKQKWINFYPSSGKVHWDGEKSKGRGINYLLSQLNIDLNLSDTIEIILAKGKVEKISDNQVIIKNGAVIRIEMGKPFSVIPDNSYKISILGDIIELKALTDFIFMSCNKIYFTENNLCNKKEVEL